MTGHLYTVLLSMLNAPTLYNDVLLSMLNAPTPLQCTDPFTMHRPLHNDVPNILVNYLPQYTSGKLAFYEESNGNVFKYLNLRSYGKFVLLNNSDKIWQRYLAVKL